MELTETSKHFHLELKFNLYLFLYKYWLMIYIDSPQCGILLLISNNE